MNEKKLKPKFYVGQTVYGVEDNYIAVPCKNCKFVNTKRKGKKVTKFEINRIIIYSDHIEYGNENFEKEINFAYYEEGTPNVFATEKQAREEAAK